METTARLVVFSSQIGWVAMVGVGKVVTYLTIGHGSKKAALETVGSRIPGVADSGQWNTRLVDRVRAYASGAVDDFRDVPVDPGRLTEFQRRVVAACRCIPYGGVATYGELAVRAGSPHAARAVGNCMARNPIPLLIPCHRVVGASGGLGGFSSAGGTDLKRCLLEMEDAASSPQ